MGPSAHLRPPRHRDPPAQGVPRRAGATHPSSEQAPPSWLAAGRCLRRVPTIRGVTQGIARYLPFPHQPHVAGARHIEHGC